MVGMQASQGCQAGLVGNLQGMWCDAVPALVFLEWQAARQAICQPPAASTAAAVQAWLQVLSAIPHISISPPPGPLSPRSCTPHRIESWFDSTVADPLYRSG